MQTICSNKTRNVSTSPLTIPIQTDLSVKIPI